MHRYWDGYPNWMTPWSGWWVALQIVGFLLLVVLAVMLIRHFAAKTPFPDGTSEALEIAKLRLAKGEITPEQFEEIKNSLLR